MKALLKQYGAYVHSPIGSAFGTPTLDMLVCSKGRFAGIETKAEGKRLTPRQEQIAADIHAAGGAVFVLRGVNDPAFHLLQDWLKQ